MKKIEIKYSTKWLINGCIYALVIGVPYLGYLMQSEVLQNFGVALMFLFGGLVTIVTACVGLGTLLAYIIKDRADQIDMYESLTTRNLLFYVCRILMLATVAIYIWIGYPVFGVYLLLAAGFMTWMHSIAGKNYAKFKETLKG